MLVYPLRRRRKFSGWPLKLILLNGLFKGRGLLFGREKAINTGCTIEMWLALQVLLTIDHFNFVLIFFDEHVFVPEQRMQLFLVVFCCRFLILQLIFIHLFVLLHFFALLLDLMMEFVLEFPQLVLQFAAVSTVSLNLCSLSPYLDPKRVVFLFGAFELLNQAVFFVFVLMNGTF